MLKVQDLRLKTEKELLALISELKGKLLALRFENATGQLTEIHLIKETRRDIARVFTVIKEKESERLGTTTREEVVKSQPQKKKTVEKQTPNVLNDKQTTINKEEEVK